MGSHWSRSWSWSCHFLKIIDRKSLECDEVHVIFDRYDFPNSLKEGTRQFCQGCNRSLASLSMMLSSKRSRSSSWKAVMSTRSRCASILHLISLSVRKTPRRPMQQPWSMNLSPTSYQLINTSLVPRKRQTRECFYVPWMPQREEQHPSVFTQPRHRYIGSLQAYAMKHQWSLALVTSVGQFLCVLYTTSSEVNFVAVLPGFHTFTRCH